MNHQEHLLHQTLDNTPIILTYDSDNCLSEE